MPSFANPDQALIHRFLQSHDNRALAIDSNPMAIALGAELLRIDGAAGTAELAFAPDPLFVQGTGVLQGGALTAMLDFAMAFATLATLPRSGSCATVNLNAAYLRPAPNGRYLARAEVERRGRALAFTQARLLRAEDDRLVATASSTLALSGSG